MNTIIFNDEITLYWDLPENYEQGDKYILFVNEKKEAQSTKTHFKIKNLIPETEQAIRIEHIDKNGELKEVLVEKTIVTSAEKKKIDVTKAPYEAKGDGKTMNTKILQKAIDDCQKDECVYFPKGTYLTGSLNLHSDMELFIEDGAVIKGSTEVDDYLPKRPSRFEGYEMMCYSSLINMGEMDHTKGYNCENVVIRGGGMISGGGKELRKNVLDVERERLKDYMESLGDKIKTYENNDTIPGRARPRLVNMSNCQNIIISNVTMEYGPAWNVHMIYSENIITEGCTIRSKGVNNGDGWNPDSSVNCTLFDTDFDTGDDMVAIKSGKNPEGDKIARPSVNIKVFDCRGNGYGCAIGSEMSGGVSDVSIWDCDFTKVFGGIVIKGTPERGGYIKNVSVKNCTLSTIKILSSVNFNNDGEAADDMPYFENFEFSNIKIKGITGNCDTGEFSTSPAVYLSGFEKEGHKLKNVKLKNIYLPRHSDGSEQSIEMIACEGVSFENIISE